MASTSDIPSLEHTTHQYGEHSLQRVGVWQYASSELSAPLTGYWIVFIHGGGWRDPRNTLYDFVPSSVRGFASIDYRLSPHPDFPQDHTTTPATELRIAQHPDHLDDVRSALSFLNAEYSIGGEYVLVGHSAGATLAYQLFMGGASVPLPVPAAIIGIAGIYDLIGLCVRKEGYDSFIGGAFGADQSTWDAASPATFDGDFKTVLAANGSPPHLSILAASPEDTLIDMPETNLMAEKLAEDDVNLTIVRSLDGEHDSIWEDGSQIADLVIKALAQLQQQA
ncbi:Kynurenine formamidase [Cladobotryum mycophilum]|uniref:Kynurenine formamidase n=1 Tax=Cladobotryum mycophilum TaxID=491253 RepID=A0ABR0SM55_9HYPO